MIRFLLLIVLAVGCASAQAQDCPGGVCRLPRVQATVVRVVQRPVVQRAVQPVQVVRQRVVTRRAVFPRLRYLFR